MHPQSASFNGLLPSNNAFVTGKFGPRAYEQLRSEGFRGFDGFIVVFRDTETKLELYKLKALRETNISENEQHLHLRRKQWLLPPVSCVGFDTGEIRPSVRVSVEIISQNLVSVEFSEALFAAKRNHSSDSDGAFIVPR